MHDTLRRRILRRLETLPEPQLYQVLDYIEFLESRYASTQSMPTSGLQRLAERLEDGLRSRTLSPSTLREAFQLIGAADRALGLVSEAGREILSDLQALGEADGSELPPADIPTDHEPSAAQLEEGLPGGEPEG
jgi:hypothetical protein